MTTPADELRTAAAKLRHLAGVASPGPWRTTGAGDHGWTVSMPSSGLAIETEDSEQGAIDADYIAAMHPGVGAALADWLETEAQTWAGDEVHNRCSPTTCTLDAALAVARKTARMIDGGQP